MLSDRKRKILQVVIDDYISSASPVSSKALHETHFENYSPATIRNELSQLEDMGLLTHPHTSAGRVPTSLAYKMYINELLDIDKLTKKELSLIKSYFKDTTTKVEDIVEMAVKAISDMTNYTSIGKIGGIKKEKIASIKLIKLSDKQLILVLITVSGKVKDISVEGEFAESDEYIKSAENILLKHFTGHNINELAEIEKSISDEFATFSELFGKIFEVLKKKVEENADNLYLSGESKIFEHPEYNDLDNVKGFLTVLDSKDDLKKLLETGSDGRISINVTIGGDEKSDLPKDCSLVTASYDFGDKNFGTYGVIGPARMDYSKVLKVLNGIGEILNEFLSDE